MLLRGPEVGQQSGPILVFPDLLKNELDKYNLKPIKIEPIILTTSGLMIKSSNFFLKKYIKDFINNVYKCLTQENIRINKLILKNLI